MSDSNEQQPNIFPALRYRDTAAALEWLHEAFGFEKSYTTPGPGRTISHAEMSLGAGVVMLGSAPAGSDFETPDDVRAASQSVYVPVNDVDAHYGRARSTGAEITRALSDTEYGSREYSARDLEGQHWSFGSYRPSAAA